MRQVWSKLGLLYCPRAGVHEKLNSHAANPLPLKIDGDVFRIFYSSRDANNRSSIGGVDVDLAKRKVLREYNSPFLLHGEPGSFYEDGISIGCNYWEANQQYILFMGWQSPKNAHWRGDIGRIKVNEDLSLQIEEELPFLNTAFDEIDPLSLSYPCVLADESKGYHMWYGSTKSWDTGSGEMLHVINYAKLKADRIERKGLAIPFELGRAQAFSRPTVSRNPEGFLEMWFSYRSGKGEKYRIGYATMKDSGWILALDKTGIDVSESGWDSEMIEYPWVFEHKQEKYMLYNGNDYGKTGFGLAILERE